MRIVRREIGSGIATGLRNRAPRLLVDDCAGGIGWSIAAVRAAREERRAARTLRRRELVRGSERELLAASAGARRAPQGDRRLSPPKEAALHWTIGQWRGPR